MAHDAGVGQQPPALARAVARDLRRVEAVERLAVVGALGEDRVPRQPGLRPLEDQALEQLALVALRHAPLPVVVGDRQRVLRPGAALLHAAGTWRAKPPCRSRTRSRQAHSGSSGASTCMGLMILAHWKTENRM